MQFFCGLGFSVGWYCLRSAMHFVFSLAMLLFCDAECRYVVRVWSSGRINHGRNGGLHADFRLIPDFAARTLSYESKSRKDAT